ncbi:hypothetical protein QC763_302748 [Podospora pseudopauciseta]|uniref:Uncharacterized protein n=1 Tax=Podospora pseudopauciseta TaxID=2093780 RepID=A0ABR0HFP6_9PEZI|nr:hypothetical protein QC763_302748 [Podospora pseudopauciseta]
MEPVLAFDLAIGLRVGLLLVLKMVFDIRPLNTSVFAKPQDALPADTDALVRGQPHLLFQKCSDGVEDSETGTEQCIEGVNSEVKLRPSHGSLFVNLTFKSWGLIWSVRLLKTLSRYIEQSGWPVETNSRSLHRTQNSQRRSFRRRYLN